MSASGRSIKLTCGEMGKRSNDPQTPNGLFGCGHGFAHMSAFGGRFARLAVISELLSRVQRWPLFGG